MQKRYLVYKSWNGQVHTSIEYGDLTDGEDKVKANPLELKRVEIKCLVQDLKLLKEMYPLEEATNEKASINS